ncbi:type IV secretory system conjugative DNA transfer family protein [Enterococcus wangshanyuanii]|uniref:TraD/TraG TraM recognition site domain-containing protein n=1 Tax=Enterococcus wangshanyuanii TaxID=2005703 RepID=A0ABQ1PRA4_9ENTE|nr:TraM recognition domain-containing protein [Enterococcus wangshanyuanii]GGD01803.1 hypothetical protein GCM10011573_34150 [Enterococcus wangshanyuanii]
MNFFSKERITKGKRNRRKNYEEAKQSPLRHLARKDLLWGLNIGMFLLVTFLLNYVFTKIHVSSQNGGLLTGIVVPISKLSFLNYGSIFYYPILYLLLIGLYIGLAIRATYDFYNSFVSLEEEYVQGTLEWEEEKNLLNQYYAVPVHPLCEGEDFFPGKGGFPISRVPRALHDQVRQQEPIETEKPLESIPLFEELPVSNGKIQLKTSDLTTESLESLMAKAREQHGYGAVPKGKHVIKLYDELTVPEAKPKEFYYLIAQEPSNSIILAITRGGKDVYFINPFLDILSRAERIEDRPSFVMTATKGDEPRMWYDTLQKRGYIVRICNTVRQYYSDPYNPLSVVYNFYKKYVTLKKTNKHESSRFLAEAENALKSSALTFFQGKGNQKDGDFWIKACHNLFMATGLAIADQAVRENSQVKFNPYAIYNVVNEMLNIHISAETPEYLDKLTDNPIEKNKLLKKYDGKSALHVFFLELPMTHPARKYYWAILASAPAEVTLGNVVTHFDGDMEPFLNEANAKMSATDDGFDFEEIGFGDKPVACFIVMSQSEKGNNALGMLYLEQTYLVNEKRCTLETPSRTYRDIHYIIQEAGNLGMGVANLANKWTSGLGQGLFFHLVLQDLEQLTELYSEPVKKTIVGNTGNLMYIRSGSLETNKYLAERLGKRSNYSKTRHRQSPSSVKTSETESSERIELMYASELERLKKSETVVLRLSHVDDLDGEPIYQYPIYNSIGSDSNMMPFYEYRNNKVLSWDEIPVNNEFMNLEIEDLLITLQGVSKEEKAAPSLVMDQTTQTKAYADEESLFDSLPETISSPVELRPKKKKRGDSEVSQLTLFSTNEMKAAYDEAKKKELQRKQEWYKSLVSIFPKGAENQLVKDYFTSEERSKLNIVLRITHLKDKIVMKEFKTIIENQTIHSMISFLASNEKNGLCQNMRQKIEEMKGGTLS